MELPDISGSLPEIRRLLDEKKGAEADRVLSDRLAERGYHGDFVVPSPVADILIETPSRRLFSHYRREVDMEKAQVTVRWREEGCSFSRSTFVSRVNDLIFTRFCCDGGRFDTRVTAALHDTETLQEVEIPRQESFARGELTGFAAYNQSIYRPGDYGLLCRVFTNGRTTAQGASVCVEQASQVLIVAKAFIETPREEAFALLERELQGPFDYDRELEAHTRIHGALFHGVDFSISDPEENTSNEELLLEAFEEEPSNQLMEKLYAYGRYLFLCSTREKGSLPCHLTGLFNGTYQCFWAFNMYNINFEMIYWQALTGNLPGFLRLALDYTEEMVPQFQENARKLFGCRGIWINSVNAPDSGLSKCPARHILNWTGGAAWFSQHFYDYYRFTGDVDYLREHALPFLYETALFYEDFAQDAADGYYDLYPSVSPENTPANVMAVTKEEVETAKNATMEFALMKELLTNLLEGSRKTGMYREKWAVWETMLGKIRPYQVNQDGAVKEWTDPFYEDNYHHRHHSHLYPVFPGCEVTKEHPLYPAFVRAEDLRLEHGLSDQSSWSMVFMAGIAARMERGQLALTALQTIARTCLMNNLFTVHNDWRRMGPVACADFRMAPFQIDGNIGLPGVIHEMLLQSQREGELFLLPALPEKWEKGHITGLLARGTVLCDLYWDKEGGYALLRHEGKAQRRLCLGSGFVFDSGKREQSLCWEGTLRVPFFRETGR